MCIKRADTDGGAFLQAKALRPLSAQTARLRVGGVGFGIESIPQIGQFRVELSQKLLVGQSAPLAAEHGFVARSAHAALQRERICVSRQNGRNPVAMLDEAERGLEDVFVHPAQTQDFAPKPLAGVDATALRQDLWADFVAQFRDLRRFGMAGVILPQPHHRVEVVFELRQQAEWCAVSIHGNGRAARGVDADADDLRGIKACDFGLRLLHRAFHDAFKTVEVVLRILPGDMRVLRIEQDAHLAARVVEDGRSGLRAVVEVDEEGAAGVRAVVDAEGVAFHSGLGKGGAIVRSPCPCGERKPDAFFTANGLGCRPSASCKGPRPSVALGTRRARTKMILALPPQPQP